MVDLPIVVRLREPKWPAFGNRPLANPDGPEAADLIEALVEALDECAHWVEWCIHNHDAPDSSLEEAAFAQARKVLNRARGESVSIEGGM